MLEAAGAKEVGQRVAACQVQNALRTFLRKHVVPRVRMLFPAVCDAPASWAAGALVGGKERARQSIEPTGVQSSKGRPTAF